MAAQDYSSRMWMDDGDPLVEQVRRDQLERNSGALLWTATRENDNVKIDQLKRAGVDMNRGYLSAAVDNSPSLEKGRLKDLEDDAEAEAEKAKEGGERSI